MMIGHISAARFSRKRAPCNAASGWRELGLASWEGVAILCEEPVYCNEKTAGFNLEIL